MTYNYLGQFLLPLPTDKPEVTIVRAADNYMHLAGLSDADTVSP
jgi:hypothetical protein